MRTIFVFALVPTLAVFVFSTWLFHRIACEQLAREAQFSSDHAGDTVQLFARGLEERSEAVQAYVDLENISDEQLASAFAPARRLLSPYVSYVGFGTESGAYVFVTNYRGRDQMRLFKGVGAAYSVIDFAWDGATFVEKSTTPWDGYDARTRPFYLAARSAGRGTWTRKYEFVESGLGVTYAVPIYRAGALRGVLDIDARTAEVSRWLHTQSAGLHVAVLEHEGAEWSVLAGPHSEPNWDPLKVAQLVHALPPPSGRDMALELADVSVRVRAARTANAVDAPDWHVASFVRREPFLRIASRATLLALLFAALTLLVAYIATRRIAHRLAGPVRRFNAWLAQPPVEADLAIVQDMPELAAVVQRVRTLMRDVDERDRKLETVDAALDQALSRASMLGRERALAELERESASRKLREVFARSTDVMVTFERDGDKFRVTGENPTAIALGGDAGEGGALAFIRAFMPSSQTPEPQRLEHSLRAAGSASVTHWFETTIAPFGEQGQGQYIAVGRDMTKPRAVQQALADSEARFRGYFELPGVGMAGLDAHGKCIDMNTHFAEMLEYPLSELGTSWRQATHPDDLAMVIEKMHPVLHGDTPAVSFEQRYITYSKQVIYVMVSAGAKRNASGELQGYLLIVQDITERKLTQQRLASLYEELEARVESRTTELKAANAQLKELDRLKSEFLATMSHELRTPLNSIIGFSSILAKGLAGPLVPEQERQLGMVLGSAKHLLGIINDLLDLSRIESGRMELARDEFAPADVVAEVLRTLAPQAEEKHLTLRAEVAEPTLLLIGDRRRCMQILLNLLSNAVKFTEAGTVLVRTQVEGSHYRMEVEDEGIGIPEAQIPLLFSAFRQLDGSARRAYEGTGLGLYFCQQLVHLMGGKIGIAPKSGPGTIFFVEVPLR